MGQRIVGRCPKIWGLIDLHDDYPEAFEATLIERGLRWDDIGSDQLTWRDVYALFSTLPFDAPINRAKDKQWWWYHPAMEVLVGIFEATQLTAAVVEKQPKLKKSNLPKPIPRPWDTQKDEKKLGDNPLPLDDMKAAIGW